VARIFALLILVAAVTGAAAGERFPILQPDQMNADQKKLLEALLAGPRGGGNTSPEAVQKMLRGGPFNAWMRSPDLGNRLQNVGEYIRYRTSLPPLLNEFAILITAREWTSQYAKIADELALGKRPSAMSDDEALLVFDIVRPDYEPGHLWERLLAAVAELRSLPRLFLLRRHHLA
jgi:4-carboxymuconolactone decarboxylase